MRNPIQDYERSLAAVDRYREGDSPGAPPTDWPDPDPLPSDLPEVAQFTDKLLPESLRPWVMDIARRMQCPPDYPAVAAMVGLSSVIGRKVGIRPKARDDGFEVIPNLWGLLIGRPSELKSPAMAEALKPLKQLEAKARGQHEQDLQQHAIDTQLAEMRKDEKTKEARGAVKEGKNGLARDLLRQAQEAIPEQPTRRRYIVNDATVEKLGELLNQNPTGLLLERDEISGFLRGLDREDRSNDRSFYLEAFNGRGGYTYDRIGRGTIDVPAVCLSIIGTIQPGKLIPYVGNAVHQGMGDDGLIQRFQLMVYPDSRKAWTYRDNFPEQEARRMAGEVFERLACMEPPAPLEGDDVHFIRFDDEAQQLFIDWLTELERKIREPDIHPAIEAHLAKYRSLAPSLALVIELADGDAEQVSAIAFRRAAAWCDYLESHARRVYGMATDTGITNARAILTKIKLGQLPRPFKQRDIQRKDWSGLTSAEAIRDALSNLEDYGWIQPITSRRATGGRPSTEYHVNPAIDGGES